jgi:hypothetical protein
MPAASPMPAVAEAGTVAERVTRAEGFGHVTNPKSSGNLRNQKTLLFLGRPRFPVQTALTAGNPTQAVGAVQLTADLTL